MKIINGNNMNPDYEKACGRLYEPVAQAASCALSWAVACRFQDVSRKLPSTYKPLLTLYFFMLRPETNPQVVGGRQHHHINSTPYRSAGTILHLDCATESLASSGEESARHGDAHAAVAPWGRYPLFRGRGRIEERTWFRITRTQELLRELTEKIAS